MSDYTPTTEQVRIRYSMDEKYFDEATEAKWAAEFDRWLAAHDAEVLQEGRRQGFHNGYSTGCEETVEMYRLHCRCSAVARGDGEHQPVTIGVGGPSPLIVCVQCTESGGYPIACTHVATRGDGEQA